jgi:hypothetical protein
MIMRLNKEGGAVPLARKNQRMYLAFSLVDNNVICNLYYSFYPIVM